jgi:putative transcriptional regulator
MSTEIIRFKLKGPSAEKFFQEGSRVILDEVRKDTGIHRTTLSRVSNIKGYNVATDVLDKLCYFFDVQVSDVTAYINDEWCLIFFISIRSSDLSCEVV